MPWLLIAGLVGVGGYFLYTEVLAKPPELLPVLPPGDFNVLKSPRSWAIWEVMSDSVSKHRRGAMPDRAFGIAMRNIDQETDDAYSAGLVSLEEARIIGEGWATILNAARDIGKTAIAEEMEKKGG